MDRSASLSHQSRLSVAICHWKSDARESPEAGQLGRWMSASSSASKQLVLKRLNMTMKNITSHAKRKEKEKENSSCGG